MFPEPPAWASGFRTVGVTGTNGKTSTVCFVAAALGCAGQPVARVTTVGAFVADERQDVAEDYGGFIETLRRCHERGGRHAALELTSEALSAGFARAWPCQVGVLTSFSRDHLDAHGSAEHYLASKAQLFVHLPAGGAAVLNAGVPVAALLREVVPAGVRVVRYALGSSAGPGDPLDVAADAEVAWSGTRVDFRLPGFGGRSGVLALRAVGSHFAENALGALGAALSLGIDPAAATRAIAATPPPPGRFEVVRERPWAVVDYAHTPDALARTLQTARALCAGRLWVVFGAGGERDQGKRPLLGRAARAADRVVLTSDNPRGEDARAIVDAIAVGLEGHREVRIELDRARAIRGALADATEDDVVVVAGKGHEAVQVVGSERRPFSDVEQIRRATAS